MNKWWDRATKFQTSWVIFSRNTWLNITAGIKVGTTYQRAPIIGYEFTYNVKDTIKTHIMCPLGNRLELQLCNSFKFAYLYYVLDWYAKYKQNTYLKVSL